MERNYWDEYQKSQDELATTRERLLVTTFALRDIVEMFDRAGGVNDPASQRARGILEVNRKLFPDVEI